MPKNLKSIPHATFWDCETLKFIEIPDTVQVINNGAFYKCFELEKIKVPDSVKKISFGQFMHCKNLNKIQWKGKIYTYQDLVEYNYFEVEYESKK